jgi:hypothetical protein
MWVLSWKSVIILKRNSKAACYPGSETLAWSVVSYFAFSVSPADERLSCYACADTEASFCIPDTFCMELNPHFYRVSSYL